MPTQDALLLVWESSPVSDTDDRYALAVAPPVWTLLVRLPPASKRAATRGRLVDAMLGRVWQHYTAGGRADSDSMLGRTDSDVQVLAEAADRAQDGAAAGRQRGAAATDRAVARGGQRLGARKTPLKTLRVWPGDVDLQTTPCIVPVAPPPRPSGGPPERLACDGKSPIRPNLTGASRVNAGNVRLLADAPSCTPVLWRQRKAAKVACDGWGGWADGDTVVPVHWMRIARERRGPRECRYVTYPL